mmetsp:Transcript_3957/g.11202  ORF Transcript_3957/g.11202 Transcript_3957/m.11202 type:complete len:228 (+) Transcript_3957:176-859(+)
MALISTERNRGFSTGRGGAAHVAARQQKPVRQCKGTAGSARQLMGAETGLCNSSCELAVACGTPPAWQRSPVKAAGLRCLLAALRVELLEPAAATVDGAVALHQRRLCAADLLLPHRHIGPPVGDPLPNHVGGEEVGDVLRGKPSEAHFLSQATVLQKRQVRLDHDNLTQIRQGEDEAVEGRADELHNHAGCGMGHFPAQEVQAGLVDEVQELLADGVEEQGLGVVV